MRGECFGGKLNPMIIAKLLVPTVLSICDCIPLYASLHDVIFSHFVISLSPWSSEARPYACHPERLVHTREWQWRQSERTLRGSPVSVHSVV